MKRMDLVRRKGTRAARKVPHNFSELKNEFLSRIVAKAEEKFRMT